MLNEVTKLEPPKSFFTRALFLLEQSHHSGKVISFFRLLRSTTDVVDLPVD
jgi:hypothetical protein